MFRVNNANPNQHVKYYTIVVDHDQIKENQDTSPHMIIKPPRKSISKTYSQVERFVFDRETGTWKSEIQNI